MKRLFHKSMVLLTVITMLFTSAPFAFADYNEVSAYDASSSDVSFEEIVANSERDAGEDIGEPSVNESIDNDEGEAIEEEPTNPELEHVHTPGGWIVENASFDKDGSRKQVCAECGEVLAEEPIFMVSDVRFDADPAVYILKDSAVEPELTVKDSQGTILTEGVDYTIEYANNAKAGKAKATVTLQGEKYAGTKDFQFVIFSTELKRTNLLRGSYKNVVIDKSITDAFGNDITYSIEDESIARVDASGKVFGVSEGMTVLTVKIGEFTCTSDVNVLEPAVAKLVVKEKKDWLCSYYFTSDGTEFFRVEVYDATYRDHPCKVAVDILDGEVEEDEESIDSIFIKSFTLKNGRGNVEIDSSYFTKGRDYGIMVSSDLTDYSNADYDDSCINAAIYRIYAPEAIVFDETGYDLLISQTQNIAYTSDGGAAGAIKWTSSDPSVATVSKGKVSAKAEGICTITATLPNGVSDKCTINVSRYDGDLNFIKENVTLYGITTSKLSLVNEEAITDKITWESSNTDLATIDSTGKLTTKKAGTITVTASTSSGKTATCNVTIVPKLKSSKATIYLKKTYTNKLYAAPAKVTWSSSNKKIASVSSAGKISGRKPGTCTITAKCNGRKYTCKVTVKTIKLNRARIAFYRGKGFKLKVTGGSGKINWKTTNKTVATVSAKGYVKGVNAGTCYIKATRNGYTKKCKVTVYRRIPDFGAVLWDYDTRDNYFVVKFRNVGTRKLYITSGTKVEDDDYKSYDRYIRLKKTVTIKPNSTKYVRFYVKGRTTWYDYRDFSLFYKFKYDGSTYVAQVWYEDSLYKIGKRWYETYWDDEWYEAWY